MSIKVERGIVLLYSFGNFFRSVTDVMLSFVTEHS